jgi:uncharacterized protein (TIGR02391 family)
MKLRRRDPTELLENLKRRREEAQALMQAFKRLPADDVTARLAVARQVVDKSVGSYRAMLDFLEKFSPTATKELRFKLKNHERMWEDWLTNLPSPTTPGYRALIDDRLRMMLDSSLYEQFAGIAFLAAMEAFGKKTTEQSGKYLADQLHNVIKKVSNELFYDGHYAQAIFEAYKAVNNLVKEKSRREDLDGQELMSTVFNYKNPILRLNKLRSQTDRDEQMGFMFLYMGAMSGIRNPKAHDIVKQDDPTRTMEYLALASLLARRVEESEVRLQNG